MKEPGPPCYGNTALIYTVPTDTVPRDAALTDIVLTDTVLADTVLTDSGPDGCDR